MRFQHVLPGEGVETIRKVVGANRPPTFVCSSTDVGEFMATSGDPRSSWNGAVCWAARSAAGVFSMAARVAFDIIVPALIGLIFGSLPRSSVCLLSPCGAG